MLAILAATVAMAGDLDELRATQQKLLEARDPSKLPRDEAPLDLLVTAKRQLLEWAESQPWRFTKQPDLGSLTKRLDQELPRGPEGDMDFLGGIGIELARPEGEPTWLQLTTNFGVQCGSDTSVYLYEWFDNRWTRRLSIEANGSSQDKYIPHGSLKVEISKPDAGGSRLVLATGWPPACISVWHPLFIGAFRVGRTQRVFFEQERFANESEESSARLEPNEALVEFGGDSTDVTFLGRRHILHYTFQGDEAQRIEPIALSAQDFVDEWLSSRWEEISEWSEPELEEVHKQLPREHDLVSGTFGDVERCAVSGPWQVPVSFPNTDERYFLVSEQGEHRYRMIAVRKDSCNASEQ